MRNDWLRGTRRLTYGVHSLRDGGEAEPIWLMDDYHAAIQQAQGMTEDVLDDPLPEELRIPLWEVMPALFGSPQRAHNRMYGD